MIALAGAVVFGLQGCAQPGAGTAGGPTATAGHDVRIDDGRLVLTSPDGGERVVAHTDPDADGELVHAAVRPGDHDRQTVLALARAAGDGRSRYELRYLTVDGDTVTDLYWFPWRLQVADDLADTLDLPPLPVWSPDGDALAWLEWDGSGTRLRTVGWHDEDVTSNPSDDVASYRVDEVPAGTQLQAWETGDGVPVLRGSDGDTTWRIELDLDAAAAIAMAEAGSLPAS
ncbi:hypothetical protein [Egicoccus sp. AB-alg6-2]|uniref:hypothetical protein n=1 Tax=Egicoccus sp. AB-alg6-2 TaxID=3242692 RepID=UPI00359D08F4